MWENETTFWWPIISVISVPKTIVIGNFFSKITYNVSSGMLNPTVPRCRRWCHVFITCQHTDTQYWYRNLSVCDVLVLDENGLTYCHSFSPYGSPIILVLSASNIFTKFRWGPPLGGCKYRCGIKVLQFSTNKSLYLADDTRYRHSYYGRLIGTHMRSIKWCHFQWPWMNPNPVFKVTPFFDAKYLTNGYRYSHSYYRRRIGNRTQAFEWHQFHWPWVTSKPDFKVMILFNVRLLSLSLLYLNNKRTNCIYHLYMTEPQKDNWAVGYKRKIR